MKQAPASSLRVLIAASLVSLGTLSSLPVMADTIVPSSQPVALPANAEVTDRLIVRFAQASGKPQAMAAKVANGLGVQLTYMRAMGVGSHVLRLERKESIGTVKQLAARVTQQPGVLYAEPDKILQHAAIPNDSYYADQWHYSDATGGINAPEAWDTKQGAGVNVAVIDTGFRAHRDLAANLLPGYDMISDTFVSQDGDGRDADASDPGDAVLAGECGGGYPSVDYASSWHGTHVAGTIAAVTNNNEGVAGVAYEAKVVPVRVLGKCGGYTSDIADGMLWAAGIEVPNAPVNINPAQVLNLSLGGSGACSRTTQNAINRVRNQGAVVVVAAGNSNANTRYFTPANCRNVVAVAATTKAGERAYYSNYGKEVDVAAPGGDMRTRGYDGILSTLNDGQTAPGNDVYAFYQGTSMAAPHVSGVAALAFSANSALTPADVESVIKNSARAFPLPCSNCGKGIVDAAAAVANAASSGGDTGGDTGGNNKPCRGKKCAQ